MNPKVLDYIAKSRAAGLGDEEIAARLAGLGTSEEDMRDGFAQAPPKSQPPQTPPDQTPQTSAPDQASAASQADQPSQTPQTFAPAPASAAEPPSPAPQTSALSPASQPPSQTFASSDAQRRQVSPAAAKAVFLIFLLAGLGVSYYGYTIYATGEASKSWPTASGTIIESRVVSSQDSDGGVTYKASIGYSYSVSGRTYSSGTVSSGDYGSSDRSHAQGVVSDHPLDSKVTVYYDPANPTNALLEPGIPMFSFLMVTLIGVLFAVIGFAGVTGMIKPTMYYSNRPYHTYHDDSHMSVTAWKRH